MGLLKNKTFTTIICLVSFTISGLIFTDKVFGVAVRSNMDMGSGKITNLGTPSADSDAATLGTVKSAVASPSWNNFINFPSACSSGYYVSGVGLSLACTALPSAATNYWTSSGSNIYSNNSGNVGIGNSSPSYKLDVSGDSRLDGKVGIGIAPSYRLDVAAPSSGDTMRINRNYGYASIKANSGDLIVDSNGSGSSVGLNWYNSGNVVLAYGGGRVGIGTSNPGSKLTVNGEAMIQGRTDINGPFYVSAGTVHFYGSKRDNDDYTEAGDLMADDGIWAGGKLRVGTEALIWGKSYLQGGAVVGGYNNLTLEQGSLGVGLGSGINPSYKLHVNGDAKISGAASIGGTLQISDSYAGKVSVGSSLGSCSGGPSYCFTVAGDSNIAGDLSVGDDLTVNDYVGIGTSPNSSYRLNVSGDSYLNGNVGIGTSPSYSYKLNVNGNANVSGTFSATTKNFVINHPLDPKNKQLVHSSLEGPEVGVYYRGEGQLENGRATIELPSYFEALTRKENRTVLLTPKFDNNEPISNLAASNVENGKFYIRAIGQDNLSQKFYWEVKAIRGDVPLLEVEKIK